MARVMSQTPRMPLSCSQMMVVGASISMPGTTSVPPIQARTSLIGPNSQSGGGELVPPVVEDQDPPTALHLLELPLVAARRHVPAAPAARHHLHVVAAHLADARRDSTISFSLRSGS